MSPASHDDRPVARSARALLPRAALLVLTAGAYYVAARLGLRLALVERNVTPVWPPTGIAVVALLVFGRSIWPAITIAAFLVNLPISTTPVAALTTALGNTAAPLLAAELLRLTGFRLELDRLRDALALVFLGAFAGMAVSATVGTTTLVVSGAIPGHNFGPTWSVWWTGDAMGVLVVAPFLMTLARLRRLRLPPWHRLAEAAGIFACLVASSQIVVRSHLTIQYLVFPFLVWAALRFRQQGAAPAALIVSGTAVWAAGQGMGPYATGTLLQKMVTLQFFNGAVALTSFVLAAIATERVQTREQLRRSGVELEHRVRSRTAELAAVNEQLAQTAKQLEEAQRIAHIGSWDWDIAADTVRWSDELYRIYGLEPQAFEATYRGFLDRVHPDDRAHTDEVVQRAQGDRAPFSVDHRIVRPDGTERVVRARGEVVTDEAGTPVRMLGTAEDITEQRRSEDLLRRFIANAAHELRTPLTAVAGMAAVVAERGAEMPPERLTQALEVIGRQGERVSGLINDLLDLSRVQHGPTPRAARPVELSALIKQAAEAAPAPHGTTLAIAVPDHLSAMADPDQVVQILVNLLNNAYSHGGPSVSVEGEAQGAAVRVVVADDGPGVPEHQIPRLFEPFSRGTKSGGGSGLGLAIVRSIAQALGGTIAYEPGAPSGARFVVTLPSA
jgi:PAS domain S-box-containing protein